MDHATQSDQRQNLASDKKDKARNEDEVSSEDMMSDPNRSMPMEKTDLEYQKTQEGEAKFKRLGWKRLTIVLIVEAIALGSLSLPSAFATLGMLAGIILTIGLGLVAIYTSNIVGQVKLKHPSIVHYADAGRMMFGRVGYEVFGAMFSLQLIFLVGSHCLTGTIAFETMVGNHVCAIAFGVVSAIILLLLAIPPSFAEVAILGYIDFGSIIIAIGVTMIATGINKTNGTLPEGTIPWSWWPKEDTDLMSAVIALTNIVFAYSFAITQFTMMSEMHTPSDYKKSIWALGISEIIIYTLTGSLVYSFVGQTVESPALLSAGNIPAKVAFGLGLPVIYISGSINTTVVGRYIHDRIHKNDVKRYINTKGGWIAWLSLITVITVVAWIIAESIPFFNDLLALSSALFITGFTFYFPSLMWFFLLREGPWYARKNLLLAVINLLVGVMGVAILIGGTWASIADIKHLYEVGAVRRPFSCQMS